MIRSSLALDFVTIRTCVTNTTSLTLSSRRSMVTKFISGWLAIPRIRSTRPNVLSGIPTAFLWKDIQKMASGYQPGSSDESSASCQGSRARCRKDRAQADKHPCFPDRVLRSSLLRQNFGGKANISGAPETPTGSAGQHPPQTGTPLAPGLDEVEADEHQHQQAEEQEGGLKRIELRHRHVRHRNILLSAGLLNAGQQKGGGRFLSLRSFR